MISSNGNQVQDGMHKLTSYEMIRNIKKQCF